MKKNLNKLATLALTGILMTGMSFGALAEGAEQPTGVFAGNETLTLTKKLNIGELSNDEASADVPTASYTYTVTAGTAGTATGTQDGSTVTLPVEAGVINANTNENHTVTVNFAPSDRDVKDKTGNYAEKKEIKLTFDAKEFKHAGIYRYVITETADSANPTTITHDRRNYSDKRVLDVWVTNGENGLVISDYTLYRESSTGAYNADSKSWGWTDGSDEYTSEDEAGADAEYFKTTDLKVEKKITGALANKSDEFAFTIDLEPVTKNNKTNTYTGMQVTVMKPNGTKEIKEVEGNKISVTGITLGDSESVVIYGLPSDVNYTVSEVDTTSRQYVATSKVTTFAGNDIDSKTATELTKEGSGASIKNTATVENEIGEDGQYMQVTNELKETTPTGVVMDIAPYAAMILGAGAFAGVFLGRKKSEDEE